RERRHPAEGETPRCRRHPPKALPELGAPGCAGSRVPSRERGKRSLTVIHQPYSRPYSARMVAFLAMVAVALLTVAWARPSQAANSGSVSAQGGQFILNGKPFHFVGTNAHYLIQAAAWGNSNYTDDTM